jgi:ribosomal-protein-alanine N-acetyltransferase
LIGMFQKKHLNCPDLRAGALRLVAITPEMLQAELDDDMSLLGDLLHAKMTVEWPPLEWEPHVFRFILKQYDEFPETVGWHRYVVLTEALGMTRTLVGAVGGFPKANGDAEIGYSTLPQFQRRGYATAGAKTLVEWLLQREGIASVSANTFPTIPESIKVMERCGMTYVGEGEEAGTVRYQRLR